MTHHIRIRQPTSPTRSREPPPPTANTRPETGVADPTGPSGTRPYMDHEQDDQRAGAE